MLLTKTVKLKWNSKNKKWYESKGYIFTKWKDEFEVKVEDLTKNSHILVEVQCDECKKRLDNVIWENYTKYLKKNDKYYCSECSIKLYRIKKQLETRLKNGKSFEIWCNENNRQDILELWDYTLNECEPREVCYSTNKKYWFKCSKGLHESEFKNINGITTNKNTKMYCNKCNSIAQYLIDTYGENALDLYWNYEKNININPWEINKCSDKLKVWIKCQEKDYHGSYEVTTASFTHQESRCPYCVNANGKVHALDSLGTLYPEVITIWSDKNTKTPFEYSPYSEYLIWLRCNEGKHEDFKGRINDSNKCNFRCPKCSRERGESFLQEKVRLYLENLGYVVLHERNCTIIPKNTRTKRGNNTLPFDNEIKELKLIIEVHGEQHYNERSGMYFTKSFDLHKRKLYDRYKRMYAKSKGYYYLEIPYWEDDKNETWQKLIDNKINEIVNKII